MITELKNRSEAAPLFDGWEETLIVSCLSGCMGTVAADRPEHPAAAYAQLGCFRFLAGEPMKELTEVDPDSFLILVPQNEAWEKVIEASIPRAKKFTRYAIRKDTQFDKALLRRYVSQLPEGYELKRIDAELYDQCLENAWSRDFVSSFESKEAYLRDGRGFVVLKGGKPVAGASSFSFYPGGIEIEVDTVRPERRKHLALASSAALILLCLEEGLYPSWDAHNMDSVRLSEKLGYRFSHAYTAYEVFPDFRLEEVNEKNVWKILKLKVSDDQNDFVATNTESIVEAYLTLSRGGHVFPFGIYSGSRPVGFLMIGYDTDDTWENPPKIAKGNYNLWRLMIDRKYQGNGFGRKALKLALDFARTQPCGRAEYMYLSYEPENIAAKTLYHSMGFTENGETDEDEIVAAIRL